MKVERVEVKDVRVPAQLMRAMAAEAEAAREARAKIIAAEGEEKASASLRNAANIISENKGALQVYGHLSHVKLLMKFSLYDYFYADGNKEYFLELLYCNFHFGQPRHSANYCASKLVTLFCFA